MFFTLSDEQMEKLEMLKTEFAIDNLSAFLSRLIVEEARRVEIEKAKRGPGRPRKEVEEEEDIFKLDQDYTDDLPKNIAFFGRMIGKREYEDINERQKFLKS